MKRKEEGGEKRDRGRKKWKEERGCRRGGEYIKKEKKGRRPREREE